MKNFISIIIILFLCSSHLALGQTDPGTENLMHQWTFDDGTVTDAVTSTPVNGQLLGGATIVNKALKLTAQGQYVSFSGSGLALNVYPVISQEIWFQSVAGANTGYTMLSYFGKTGGDGLGYNYLSTSVARGDNVSKTAISSGTYDSELAANGQENDDGLLHQLVSVLRSDSIILFIDGKLISKTVNNTAHAISVIATDLALLGKGGYNSDPTWLGSISKFSIYNKSLSKSEVQFLFEKGAEALPMIVSSENRLAFDDKFLSATIKITGLNLSENITVTSPEGISLSSNSIDKSASETSLTLTYDGTSAIDGIISLSSTGVLVEIPVKSFSNSCFTPLYNDKTNLITDPWISNISNFTGSGLWGINFDSQYSYCGATSGKVVGSGSFEKNLTGILKANTTYHVKAKVYKQSNTGENMGNVTYTLDMSPTSNPTEYNLIKIAMDSACYYFNKYTNFVANIYVYYNTGIPTAQASYHGSIGFGANQRYMWVGTAMHEMAHYFGSGTSDAWWALMLNGTWNGTVASALMKSITGGTISGDTQHYWPYGINQKEEITGMGSVAVQQEALANVARLVKAMLVDDAKLPTNNPSVGLGISGYDNSLGDIFKEVFIPNSWQDVEFTFTAGSQMKSTQKLYLSGGTGYIDNLEMYELASIYTSVNSIYLDENTTQQTFSVSGINLTEAITISVPNGITINTSEFPADVSGTVEVTYDGVSQVAGNIVFTSGSVTKTIPVFAANESDCFTPLYDNLTNLIPDPKMNTISGSWGKVSVISGTEAYCGLKCGKISGTAICYPNGGSINSPSIAWAANSKYRIHAKIKTLDGTFNMGVQNANVGGASGDYNITVANTAGVWTDFDATFTTGTAPSSGVAFFNNCGSATGKTAYIDNWEIYNITSLTGIETPTKQNFNVYTNKKQIITDFNLEKAGKVEFTIFSIQGARVIQENGNFVAGKNQFVMNTNLQQGIYLVQLINAEKRIVQRIVVSD